MSKDYISTDALHGLDYLAHARAYSHKYIKREPDGKGGWNYTYPSKIQSSALADLRNTAQQHLLYAGGKLSKITYRQKIINERQRNRDAKRQSESIERLRDVRANRRNEDKATQIYKEGLEENKATPVKQNIAQQAVSTITTVAKNTYDAGINFLKKLFSTPIITTKKTIDVHVVGNMR